MISCNNATKKESQEAGKNQTIYFDGDIITMKGNKAEYAEAVVRENDKIVFVGTKAEAEQQYANAQKYDLKGKTMLPAFIDPHSHVYGVGLQAISANLLPPPDGGANTVDKIISILSDYASKDNGKKVIDASGWIIERLCILNIIIKIM